MNFPYSPSEVCGIIEWLPLRMTNSLGGVRPSSAISGMPSIVGGHSPRNVADRICGIVLAAGAGAAGVSWHGRPVVDDGGKCPTDSELGRSMILPMSI